MTIMNAAELPPDVLGFWLLMARISKDFHGSAFSLMFVGEAFFLAFGYGGEGSIALTVASRFGGRV